MARSALCIGINDYPGTGMDLKGCVNDAEDWAAALAARGFSIERLHDAAATKSGIVAAIQKIIGAASGGDEVVITFSGHGTYAPDQDGDEPDGLDEAICPYDIKSGQVLIDDEIHALFSRRQDDVRIILISDSCHSGTVTRAAPADPAADGARPRFLPLGAWMPDAALPRGIGGKELNELPITAAPSPWAGGLALTGGGDLLMAGCEEGPNRFSYDGSFNGRPNGAFTYYALKALKTLLANATYSDWHAAIRQSLPSASFPQKPQIFGSPTARKFPVLA